jgi:hypothetical protein
MDEPIYLYFLFEAMLAVIISMIFLHQKSTKHVKKETLF